MKKALFVLLIAIGFSSCKEDCKTCPENYVLKNNECECESGVIINGDCQALDEFRESNGFVQELTPVCDGFQGVEKYKYAYFYNASTTLNKINIDFYGSEISSESTVVYFSNNDSFYSGKYSNLGLKGITFKKNGGEYFEKQIDGETCYLRCNIKVLSSRHMKYYFFFANLKDERKSEYCIRHFYQP